MRDPDVVEPRFCQRCGSRSCIGLPDVCLAEPTPAHADPFPDLPTAKKPIPQLDWKYRKHDILLHTKTNKMYVVVTHAFIEASLEPSYVYRTLGAPVDAVFVRPKHEFEDEGRFALHRHADSVY